MAVTVKKSGKALSKNKSAAVVPPATKRKGYRAVSSGHSAVTDKNLQFVKALLGYKDNAATIVNATPSKSSKKVKQLPKTTSKYTDTIAIEAIEAAGKEASATAMKVMGYTIIEEKGYVVIKNADGRTEKIGRI